MRGEYEHDGLIYQEPLPRTVLVNFSRSVLESIRTKGHNAKSCLVVKQPGEPVKSLAAPSPPHEVDLLIIRDQGDQQIKDIAAIGNTAPQRFRTLITFSSSIEWPSGYTDTLDAYCGAVLDRGGVCVFLVSDVPGLLLQRAALNITVSLKHTLCPDTNAFRFRYHERFESASAFCSRWVKEARTCVGLEMSGSDLVLPLLEGADGIPYAALVRPAAHPKGLILCLPDYGDRAEVPHVLLSDVLPPLAPALFPFRRDLGWTHESEFMHPEALALRRHQQALREETASQLTELESRIETVQTEERYLLALLTQDGPALTAGVRNALTTLATLAKIPGWSIDLVAGEEAMELRWDQRVFLLSIAGQEQPLGPAALNDLTRRHRAATERAAGQKGRVHSLLIANSNHGGGVDPRKRGEPFGLATREAGDRLSAEGHGMIETFALFRLIRGIQRGELAVMSDDLLRMLYTVGLLETEDFLQSVRKALLAPMAS